MSTFINTDDTWLDSGSTTCDVHGCSQPAAIIADTWNRERFCASHTPRAADGCGWYRITGSREHHLGLVLSVQRL